MTEPVFELREPDPPEPCTWERIAAFYRILACAPDVYQRVKTAVEASTVAALFEVVEHPWLNDGQVLSIDPAALKLPPFELPASWAEPQYRCANCLTERIWTPGYCLRCEPIVKARARSRPFSPIITGLGGTGF